jgi:hypothetical protein
MPSRNYPHNDFPYQDYPYRDFPYCSHTVADQPRRAAKKSLTMNKRVNKNPGLILSLLRLIAAIVALPFRIAFTLFFRLHKKA